MKEKEKYYRGHIQIAWIQENASEAALLIDEMKPGDAFKLLVDE